MPKPKRFCSIHECGKPCRGHGFCNAHYQRWCTYGDPLGGGTAWGEPQRYLKEEVFTYDGDDCLTWPYAKKGGYGKVYFDGKLRLVSRIACEHRHGPPPTSKHEAAHSCGNGHLGCVAKRHVSWKTPKENNADKIVHGTYLCGSRQNGAKINEADVLQIRALKGRMLHKEIAEQFSISRQQVDRIINNQRWAWLESPGA